jgi:hypothetical protein
MSAQNAAFYFPMTGGAYPSLAAAGFVGTTKGEVWNKTCVNSGGQAANVRSVTTAVTTAITQSFDIYPTASPGSKVTISATGSTTATLSAYALIVAFESNPTAFGLATISQVAGVLTITGRSPGIAFTIDNLTNVTTALVTSAASAQRIAPGLGLIRTGYDEVLQIEKVQKPVASLYTAMSVGITIASMSGGRLRIVVQYAGITYPATVAYNTSNDQTVADLATALETIFNTGALAGNSIAWSAASGVLTGTVDDAGAVFTAVIDIANATGATQATIFNGTDVDPTYSLPASFAGVSQFDGAQTESSPGANDSAAAANARLPVSYGGPGSTYVSVSAIPTAGAGAWLDTATATPGAIAFAGAASGSGVPLWAPNLGGWLMTASGENDTTNLLAGVRVHHAV